MEEKTIKLRGVKKALLKLQKLQTQVIETATMSVDAMCYTTGHVGVTAYWHRRNEKGDLDGCISVEFRDDTTTKASRENWKRLRRVIKEDGYEVTF